MFTQVFDIICFVAIQDDIFISISIIVYSNFKFIEHSYRHVLQEENNNNNNKVRTKIKIQG